MAAINTHATTEQLLEAGSGVLCANPDELQYRNCVGTAGV
jgi:hypothetical protein